MTETLRRASRHERGARMAVVRSEFIAKVESSPARRYFREHLTAEAAAAISDELAQWLPATLLGRRMLESDLLKVLDTGRFLTQAEIGSVNPTRPPDLERSVWTIDTDDPADLPVYGYAASEGDVLDPDGGPNSRMSLSATFGPARIVFKDCIRPRTTFTVHDSLYRLATAASAPSAVVAPSQISWPPDGDITRETLDHGAADEFVEIQVLGGVYEEDIEHVIFDEEPSAATKHVIDGRIPYSVRVDGAPQPEA